MPRESDGRSKAGQAQGLVAVTDGVEHEGQESVKIVTPSATWYYHKAGAGFASIEDADGNDWIGYHPGGRSAGEFRGIPNLVNPEGYFHPGGTECVTEIAHAGPDKAVLLSRTNDDRWQVRWEVQPQFAHLTVLKAAREYWFLYEGTPGGKLDEGDGRCLLSDGRTISAGERWNTRLASPRWACFTDAASGRGMLLLHHEDDGEVDSYWPMEHNMTVFGFGRINLVSSLRKTPARFTVGLIEQADSAAIPRAAASLLEGPMA